MSWKLWLPALTLSALGGLGCRQQTFLTEADYRDAHTLAYAMPQPDPGPDLVPRRGAVPPPASVVDTDRKPRYLSLREAIAIALENGTVGLQTALTPGSASDVLGGFVARNVQTADGIRVLAFDPAIVANDIEISLAKFDAIWTSALTWSRTETPLGISPTTFTQTGAPTGGLIVNHNLNFSTTLAKPLPTGGTAGITFGVSSVKSSPGSAIDPAVQPSLQFTFEQPLLLGFGEEINQLRDTHPGSVNFSFPVGGQVEGILITRIRFDQQRAEFERNLHYLLLNVEAAYWNLYGAYYNLYSREEGMRYAYESWRLTNLGFQFGRAAAQDLAQTRLQYEQFRSQRLTALGQVLESERQLRGLLGLPIEDGCRLVPSDAPTLAPVKPDWPTALNATLARRPELLLARQDVKFRQLDLIRQKNNLLPDLRFIATDQIHSVGSQIDGGPTPINAFHNLLNDPFNNFSVGLQLNMPIGHRVAHAAVRDAQLNLQRSYTSLRIEEDKAERFLGVAYRQVLEFQDQIQVQQAALQAATDQLERYYELFEGGRAKPFGADLILALQNWSNSVASYYAAIVQYNNALATFDFSQGTILERDSVVIGEGPLPSCAQVRAVEHERQRTEAHVLRDLNRHHAPAVCPAPTDPAVPKLPEVPRDTAPSLPALQHERPPVPDLPEEPAPMTLPPLSVRPAAVSLGTPGEGR